MKSCHVLCASYLTFLIGFFYKTLTLICLDKLLMSSFYSVSLPGIQQINACGIFSHPTEINYALHTKHELSILTIHFLLVCTVIGNMDEIV